MSIYSLASAIGGTYDKALLRMPYVLPEGYNRSVAVNWMADHFPQKPAHAERVVRSTPCQMIMTAQIGLDFIRMRSVTCLYHDFQLGGLD